MNASISATPAVSQASTICCASAEVIANGFSHRTCLPAAAAQRPYAVKVVREGDVDGVDLGVVDEGLVRAVVAGDAELRRGPRRPASRPERRSRAMVQRSDRCIAGMTLLTAIEAQPRTPQRTRSLTTTSPACPLLRCHAQPDQWRPSWTPHRNGRGPPGRRGRVLRSSAVRIELATIVVDDYDRVVEFFVGVLGFELVEDSAALTNDGRPKRWVVVRPPGAETGILLARADGERQAVGGWEPDGGAGRLLPPGRRLRRRPPARCAHRGRRVRHLSTPRALRACRRVRRHRRQPMGPARRAPHPRSACAGRASTSIGGGAVRPERSGEVGPRLL